MEINESWYLLIAWNGFFDIENGPYNGYWQYIFIGKVTDKMFFREKDNYLSYLSTQEKLEIW